MSDGTDDEHSVTFTSEDVLLANMPRFPAALSILGSTCIFTEVLADQRQQGTCSGSDRGSRSGRSGNNSPAIQRILLAMSLSDLFMSWGWVFTTLMTPVGTPHIWGAAGNTLTCTIQGFFINIGWMATPLFNTCLSLYYLLIIKKNWSERQLSALDPFVHGIIWVIALSSSIVGLPLTLYNNNWQICWIDSIPTNCLGSFRNGGVNDCIRGNNAWIFGVAFTVFPLYFCMVLQVLFMGATYVSVRHMENRTMLYAGASVTDRATQRQMSRKFATQAMWYIGAFLLTFGPSMLATVAYYATGFWATWSGVIAYFFEPLQGFLNFVVFCRPRKVMRTRFGRIMRNTLCLFDCSDSLTFRQGRNPKPKGAMMSATTDGEAKSSTNAGECVSENYSEHGDADEGTAV